MTAGTVLWDFDGTLAIRPGLWSKTMVDVLDRHRPDHGLTREDFRPAARGGFFWHRPDEPHLHLGEPDAWWAEVNKLLHAGYVAAGYQTEADELVATFREIYLDPDAWSVYDDVVQALEQLSAHGWRHVIVSNHVPELAELVEALGLSPFLDAVVTSAAVGYEKPHPEIFRAALARCASERVVVVGDNPVADVQGAQSLGLEAYLVRRPDERFEHFEDMATLCDHLLDGVPPSPIQRRARCSHS